MGELFQRQGYATALVGKWHLGHFTPAVLPTRRGFERFYGFYTGGENYFTRVSEGACATSQTEGELECFWDAMDEDVWGPFGLSVHS